MNLIDIDSLEWLQVKCNNGKTYVLIDAKTPYDLPRVDATQVIKQLEQERDALLHDLRLADRIDCVCCAHCQQQHEGCNCECGQCENQCACKECRDNDKWEWRGVCAENTKKETDK